MQYIFETVSECSSLFSCFQIKNLSQVSAQKRNFNFYRIKVLMVIISILWLKQNILIIMLGLQIIILNHLRLDAIHRMNVGSKLKSLILIQ